MKPWLFAELASPVLWRHAPFEGGQFGEAAIQFARDLLMQARRVARHGGCMLIEELTAGGLGRCFATLRGRAQWGCTRAGWVRR